MTERPIATDYARQLAAFRTHRVRDIEAAHEEALRVDWQRKTVEAAGHSIESHIAKFSGTVLPRSSES